MIDGVRGVLAAIAIVALQCPQTAPAQAPPPQVSPLPAVIQSAVVQCQSARPLMIETQNLTSRPGNLCLSFERAAKRAWPSGLAASNGAALRVTLKTLTSGPTVRCQITIDVSARGAVHAKATGGAWVATTNANGTVNHRAARNAPRDCIETVIEDLLRKHVMRSLQQQLAPTATPTGSSGLPPTPTP